jgi:predicted TIM-barrel fold metal-dependent hydrolase
MTERMLLFSSDCHGGIRTEEYGPYLEKRYHEDLRAFLVAMKERRGEGQPFSRIGDAQKAEAIRDDYERRALFATKLHHRIPAMEEDGYVGEVLFPDTSADNDIPFSEGFGAPVGRYRAELHLAGLRAYNRWLGEAAAPDRQLGLGQVSLMDPETAVREVQHMRSLGLRGVMPQWDGADPDYPRLYDERLDAFWAVCAAERLPVNFHSGSGLPSDLYGADSQADLMIKASENHFWCRRPLWHLIYGGVLERHPTLRVGFVETFADWIPRTLAHLDWRWRSRAGSSMRAICPRPPSEYWGEHCFVGAHAASLYEEKLRAAFAPGTFTYGTDFPHSGSPWRHNTEFLRATMGAAGVAESEARDILGLNIAAIYDVDVDALSPICERVGPRVQDILDVEGDDLMAELTPMMKEKVNRPPSML